MIAITWLQHRLQALISGFILVLLVLFLLITGMALASYYQANIASCASVPVPTCSSLAFDQFENYIRSLHVQDILQTLPVLVGIFIGAPLLAREVEHGTYLLAWTQGVTRQRWLAVKLCLLAGVTLGAFLLLELCIAWWNGPIVAALGPFVDFDISGVVPLAYTFFALVLGIAVGTMVRNSVGAVAITLALFVSLRVGIDQLRTFFLPTLTALRPDQQLTLFRRDWIVRLSVVDHQGHLVNPNPCMKSTQLDCLQSNGLQLLVKYHPASQFWLFQGIESTIFLVLAGALCVLTFWWLRHRIR